MNIFMAVIVSLIKLLIIITYENLNHLSIRQVRFLTHRMAILQFLTLNLTSGLVPLVPSKTGATGEVTGDQVKILLN